MNFILFALNWIFLVFLDYFNVFIPWIISKNYFNLFLNKKIFLCHVWYRVSKVFFEKKWFFLLFI